MKGLVIWVAKPFDYKKLQELRRTVANESRSEDYW